jgi:hypothetical protein
MCKTIQPTLQDELRRAIGLVNAATDAFMGMEDLTKADAAEVDNDRGSVDLGAMTEKVALFSTLASDAQFLAEAVNGIFPLYASMTNKVAEFQGVDAAEVLENAKQVLNDEEDRRHFLKGLSF